MISLLVASACLCTGSFMLIAAAGLPRPHRLSGTLVLSLSIIVVLSIATGSMHLYKVVPLLGASAGYALVAALTAWLLRRRRLVAGASVTPATTASSVDGKSTGRGIGIVANCVFGLLLLTNVAVYGWRSVLALRLPPLAYDALYYHLLPINQWMRHESLVAPFVGLARGSRDPAVLVFADTFPKNAELTGGWIALFTRSMTGVGMTQILFVAMIGISVTGVCRALQIRADISRLAGALTCLCPAVVVQSDQLYVDIARTAPLVAAFEFLLVAYPPAALTRAARANARRAALPLTGLALGFAIGVKTTNLVFLVVIPFVAVGLSIARTRADNLTGRAPDEGPSLRRSSLALLLVPTIAVGSYWYLRCWAVWGSPFWPYATGPFGGRLRLDYSGVLNSFYHTSSPVWALLKSWWDATSLYDDQAAKAAASARIYGDKFTGLLGVSWLLIGIPAVILLLVRSHWNRRAAFVVIVPLGFGTLVSPAAYNTRYSIPLAVCGVVAVAAVLDAGIAGRWGKAAIKTAQRPTEDNQFAASPPRRFSHLSVAGFTVILTTISLLAMSDAWAGTRVGNWPLVGPTLREEIGQVRAPDSERAKVGYMGSYVDTMARLDPREDIAFFADQGPILTYPLLGAQRDRDLVVLPAPATLRSAEIAKNDGFRYLYLPDISPLVSALTAQHVKLVGPVLGGLVYDLSPSPLLYRPALPNSDEVSGLLPGISTDAQATTTKDALSGLLPKSDGACAKDGVGGFASTWKAPAPFVVTAAACEFTNDTTPDRLARIISDRLLRNGFVVKYINQAGLTGEFEKPEKGHLAAVVLVRLRNRLEIIKVTTSTDKRGALIRMADNVTRRFGAIY